MYYVKQNLSIDFYYKVLFTNNFISVDNKYIFALVIYCIRQTKLSKHVPVICILDCYVYLHYKKLFKTFGFFNILYKYILKNNKYPFLITGGEHAKNNERLFGNIINLVNINKLCRHSFMIVVGGGALLDACGFMSNIIHRGIRLIRIPTTVLSQNDSGVGVKTGINFFNKKNFLGMFFTPSLVIYDFSFLPSLTNRMYRSGIAEAIKVSLIRDDRFFWYIKNSSGLLKSKNNQIIHNIVYYCAKIHMYHISVYNDSFEQKSSRPLDFGHWLAHKLEQVTYYKIFHGEAVIIGILLDCLYSYLANLLNNKDYLDIIVLLLELKYCLYHIKLNKFLNASFLVRCLKEFQEHVGGKLTIMLLNKIGAGINVYIMEVPVIRLCIKILGKFC